ncbi:hypothetical protein DEJ45_35125 [Streptomyces venezuelae]|nr:hypothetical protein DEJ45_35125 [Streptomyces venezuelae]
MDDPGSYGLAIRRERVQLTCLLLGVDHPRGQRVLSKDSFEVISGRVRVTGQGRPAAGVEAVPEESPAHRSGCQVSRCALAVPRAAGRVL